MKQQLQPFLYRDVSGGLITPYSVSNAVAPPNSVSRAINVDFHQVIGKGVVRFGTTLLGIQVAAGQTPLGLFNYTNYTNGSVALLAVFSGASSATLYYFGAGLTWTTSISFSANLDNAARCRFATMGGNVFMVNGKQYMAESSDGSTWIVGGTDCISSGTIYPTLIYATKGYLIAAGDVSSAGSNQNRVYISTLVNKASSPFITWDVSPTGNWIDVSPDDGGMLTGFMDVSGVLLVFKDTAVYRMDVINKSVDVSNVFNVGAVSQEAIVKCQGIVYYFSGIDVRQTDGTAPVQISRLGVQDFIDAIPQANWSQVSAGTDGVRVYLSIGSVTLDVGGSGQQTFPNVVLLFSPLDQTWTVRVYPTQYLFFVMKKRAQGYVMVGSETTGDVQQLNLGTSDNGSTIFYDLQTQEIEFGNRASVKDLTGQMVVMTRNGEDGVFEAKADDGDYSVIDVDLSKRVGQGQMSLQGHYFKFRWNGESAGTAPVFEGFYLPTIVDEGIQ